MPTPPAFPTISFTVAGPFTWTPPLDGTVLVQAWGGGGSARLGASSAVAGGGGGAYAAAALTVRRGEPLSGTVGAGGTANDAPATASTVGTTVLASPGLTSDSVTTPGAGGSALTSLGDETASGGDGGAREGATGAGGGGGGAGGPGGDGGAGGAGAGGVGGAGGTGDAPGGDGGAGGDTSSAGQPGSAPGGGGGGQGENGGGTVAAGADGRVTITYTAVTAWPIAHRILNAIDQWSVDAGATWVSARLQRVNFRDFIVADFGDGEERVDLRRVYNRWFWLP